MIHLPWGQDGEWTAWLWIASRKVINFSVATFFFLSAYYTKPYSILVQNGIKKYYSNRFKRLLIPYVIWASVYTFIIPIITTGNISQDWLFYFLTGKGPTYFLLSLAQFTLLNPLLQKYKTNKWCNLVFLSITPLYLIFYYSYNLKTGHEFKPEQFFCFPWFSCYYLGLLLQDNAFCDRIVNKSSILILAVCSGLLLLSIMESAFIYHSTGIYSFATSQITIGSILYSLGIIILFKILWVENKNKTRNRLTNLGDYSMGIFLIHPTFNWVFKFCAIHVPGGVSVYSTTWGFMSIHIVILIFTVMASYMTSKVLSTRFPKLSKPLGLK